MTTKLTDRFGRELDLGDWIIYATNLKYGSTLGFGKVKGWNISTKKFTCEFWRPISWYNVYRPEYCRHNTREIEWFRVIKFPIDSLPPGVVGS